MRAIASKLCLLLSLASAAGCVSLNSVSLTQIPSQRGDRIHAKASRFMLFGINFDNDYVDDVRDELRSKCKDGRVTGILTKDESVNYFLWIFMTHRVDAQGICVK